MCRRQYANDVCNRGTAGTFLEFEGNEIDENRKLSLIYLCALLCERFFLFFFFLLLQSKISFAAASRKHVSYGWKRRKFSRLSQPEFFRGIHICTVRDFKTRIVLSWTNLFRCFVIFHFRWRYSMYLYQVLCTVNLMCDLKWNILNNSRSIQY